MSAEHRSLEIPLSVHEEVVSVLQTQLESLQHRNRQLFEEKQQLLEDYIEQKSGFEEELSHLKTRLAELELASFSRPQESLPLPPREPAAEGNAEIARLRALNEALTQQLRLSEAVMQRNRQHEQLIEAQQARINFLSAKVDAFEFVKADYARLTEEFETKTRVADSLAKKLAAFTSPPPVDIELLNFQQKISDQLLAFTDTLARVFGWQIRRTHLGGFVFTRGESEISLSEDLRVLDVKNGPAELPAGTPLPELFALVTLARVCRN